MLSIPHLVIIFIVALIVFGPEKIPELARNLGRVMAEFKRATGELRGTLEDQMRELEREAQAALERRRPPELNTPAAATPSLPAAPPAESEPGTGNTTDGNAHPA